MGFPVGRRVPAVPRPAFGACGPPPDPEHAARQGLAALAKDAEAIIGEFVANAVTHAAASGELSRKQAAENLGVRLLRRTGEVICAVLDPSDSAPVLRVPATVEESGRGLQMVDALSDVWGWSPVAGRGKAVWAILFCA